MEKRTLRALVAGLAALDPVTLRGHEYTGAYLATLVAVNPMTPVDESAATPELVEQIGRLVSAAAFEAEMAAVRYRAWRDGLVFRYSSDVAAVIADIDPTAKKPLSKTAAETYVRTLPAYITKNAEVCEAQETYGTLHGAYEAAKIRQRAIYNFETQGGATTTRVDDPTTPYADAVEYDTDPAPVAARASEEPLAAQEAAVAATTRTPIPPRAGPPPPPPPPTTRPKKDERNE